MNFQLYVLKLNLDNIDNNKNRRIMRKVVGGISRLNTKKKLRKIKKKGHYYTYSAGLLDSIPYLRITNKIYIIKHKFPISKEMSEYVTFYKIKQKAIPIDATNLTNGYERALITAILLNVPVKNLTTDRMHTLSNTEESRLLRGIL